MPTPSSARRASRRPFVVAIDGPAGAGKSTVARGVARALHFAHLDTGAMYRALTAKALDAGVDPSDGPALTKLAKATTIGFGEEGLLVDGIPVGREIRTPRVSRAVSAVSAHKGVRRELVRHQRAILAKGDVVAEGRDIGTVVAPDAPIKVFLTASIDERARRRHREMEESGEPVSLPALKEEIARRDAHDSSRPVSPLIPAADAVKIDTSNHTPHQAIEEVLTLVRAAREGR
ncbi:MAG TPA: (d)CMP kinase [Actinomycetota bacterium]|nr:(d)CMP kinase [Actinomycetota bacterium]